MLWELNKNDKLPNESASIKRIAFYISTTYSIGIHPLILIEAQMPLPAYRIEWNSWGISGQVFRWNPPKKVHFKSYSVHKTLEAAIAHLTEEYELYKREPSTGCGTPHEGWDRPIAIFPVEVEDKGILAREILRQESVCVRKYKLSSQFNWEDAAALDEETFRVRITGRCFEFDIQNPTECSRPPVGAWDLVSGTVVKTAKWYLRQSWQL
jgi:hypothetical protein